MRRMAYPVLSGTVSRGCRVFCLLIAVIVCMGFLSGCGSYSGIRVGNREEVSEAIRSAMIRRSYRIRITYSAQTFDRSDTEALMAELMENAMYESEDPVGGDYLRYQYGGYRLTHSVDDGLFRYHYQAGIIPSYYTTAEQEEKVSEEIANVIENFGLAENASDLEKIRCVHDFICERTSYDTVHRHQPGSSHIQSTAYGALIYRTALCQGYAVLCYRLLKELGIENRIVTGQAQTEESSERHAWNIVRLGDAFYNMDVTLDDVNDSTDWFLKSDRTFSADHTRDEIYASDAFYDQYPMSQEDYQN